MCVDRLMVVRVMIIVPWLLLLTGCSHSSGLSQSTVDSDTAQSVYMPSNSAFKLADSLLLKNAKATVSDCNVDAIDGKPVDSIMLSRASGIDISGWAGDSAIKSVPKTVQLMLDSVNGKQDFVLEAKTGAIRADVARAQHVSAFISSGWSVHADLSAVTLGQYQTILIYRIDDRLLQCNPHHLVTIR